MALSLIDTAMVGAVSYKQLAAAALVMSVVNILFIFGIGMTLSISQMVAMDHERKDGRQVSHFFHNGFWLSAGTTVIIFLSLRSEEHTSETVTNTTNICS